MNDAMMATRTDMAHAATDASMGVVPVLFDRSPPRSSTAAGRKTASLIGTTPSGPHRRSRRTELYRCLRHGRWEGRGMGSAWIGEGSRGVVVSMESTRLPSMCAGRHAVAREKGRRGARFAGTARGRAGPARDFDRTIPRKVRDIAARANVRGIDAGQTPSRRRLSPRRRVDILSHVSSSEIGKRTTRGSTRPRSGSRASARSCSAAAPAACDRSCLPRISCRIAYR